MKDEPRIIARPPVGIARHRQESGGILWHTRSMSRRPFDGQQTRFNHVLTFGMSSNWNPSQGASPCHMPKYGAMGYVEVRRHDACRGAAPWRLSRCCAMTPVEVLCHDACEVLLSVAFVYIHYISSVPVLIYFPMFRHKLILIQFIIGFMFHFSSRSLFWNKLRYTVHSEHWLQLG